ncbi:MAG: hypothetical protein AAGI23_15210 [Bacteroidota bacterium]
MLRIPILASEINNLTDARYFAAREATWLSFPLSQINIQQIAAIQEWVDGVTIVPAFESESVAEIIEYAQFLHVDTIQLAPFYDESHHTSLSDFNIIQLVLIGEDSDWSEVDHRLMELSKTTSLIVLDTYKSNISWQKLTVAQRAQLQQWCADYPIVLGLPFSQESIADVLALGAKAINLRGSEEEKVGYKSFEEVDEILDVLEIED